MTTFSAVGQFCSLSLKASKATGCQPVLLALTVLTFLPTPAHAVKWTYRSPDELFAVRDIDNDGDRDYVIVDRLSGHYTVGTTVAPDSIDWSAPIPTGLPAVDDATIGTLTAGAPEIEVAFVHAESNRAHILPISGGVPTPFFVDLFPRIGPSGIVTAPIDGFGAAGLEHPVIATSLNGTGGDALTFYENNGGPASFSRSVDRPGLLPLTVHAYIPESGADPSVLLYVEHADPELPSDVLHAVILDPATNYPDTTLVPALPAGSDFLAADFDGTPSALVYSPGASLLVSVPIAGGFATDFTFSEGSVAQIFLLEESGGNALAAVRADRSGVDLYDFDHASGPTLRQSIDLAGFPDELVTAVLGSPDHFQLATGIATSGGSARTLGTVPFVADGTGVYQAAGSGSRLPPFIGGGLGIFTNAVFYSEDPLANDEADRTFLRTEQASDWARNEIAVAGGVRLDGATFSTAGQGGLEDSGSITVSGVAPDVSRSLINQEQDDISFAFFAPVTGPAIAELRIDPPAGTYRTSVAPTITASDGGPVIVARVGEDAPWISGKGSLTLPPIDSGATVYYFIAADDAKSPIASARYEFALSPDELDADGDGLPDFVERSLGLDPEGSGGDADGDGASDLEEAVAGTEPLDPADRPGPGDLGIDEDATLAIIATPRSVSGVPGSLAADSPSATPVPETAIRPTRVRAHDIAGALLAEATTAAPGPFPAAGLSAIPLGEPGDLVVLSTTPTFWIDPSDSPATALPRGRETVAVVTAPVVDPRAREIPPHIPGDAADWITQRRAYYAGLAAPAITRDVTPVTTLVSLLFERVVSEIAGLQRGLGNALDGVTLTAFRNGESTFSPSEIATGPNQRLRLSADDYRGLLDPLVLGGFAIDGGFDLTAALAGIEADLAPGGGPGAAALVAVASQIYALSAERGELAPGAYDSPFDTLRQFIRSPGSLPGDPAAAEGYAARITGPELAAASTAVVDIVARYTSPQELVQLTVEVSADPDRYRDVLAGTDIALFDPRLEPFEFETGTPLLPGTRLAVVAVFLDAARYEFLPVGIGSYRVVAVDFQSLADPALTRVDANGNLIDDAYERFFFPDVPAPGPFDDTDGDGFTNIQESIDGTDPARFASRPTGPRVDLRPPTVRIAFNAQGEPELDWSFPPAYAPLFCVDIYQGSDLRSLLFTGQTEELAADGAPVPAPSEQQFYRLRLRLK